MRRVIISTCICLIGLYIAIRAVPRRAAEEKPVVRGDLFESTNIVRIHIEISSDGVAMLRQTSWGSGHSRPEVKATIKEGGRTYKNVGVHLKGAAGSFRYVDDKPAFTLNFQKFEPNQNFHGLHKISLNNSVQDPSFLTEKICRELFLAAGVPAPRATHAKVDLNGRDLGVYVLVEGYNKQFLKRHFKNTKGNLYDGGFVKDINGPLAVNSGENPNDDSGLRALWEAAHAPDAERFSKLEQTLDMDRFLSFMAMEIIQCHWDGYSMNRNNWRAFHDLDSNKIVFLPHGLDQMFGVMRTSPECPILPWMQGTVARAVISTREGRRRYLERVSQLYTNVFKVDRIEKRVDEVAAAIRPVVAESTGPGARFWDQQVQWLKERIARRDESLRRQLADLAKPGSTLEDPSYDAMRPGMGPRRGMGRRPGRPGMRFPNNPAPPQQ